MAPYLAFLYFIFSGNDHNRVNKGARKQGRPFVSSPFLRALHFNKKKTDPY
ncbi:hypothetical protein B4099_0623 [Heyndrickxia coagulans]|uniref:Uncharacterized protein n=1 Tax=Heyndrickxia coagulans TaxID=1398 RepID=A0A150KHG8_HEYCO|nr:hypothetical protein B4099_0623 [Heyndrickxia coagulans]